MSTSPSSSASTTSSDPSPVHISAPLPEDALGLTSSPSNSGLRLRWNNHLRASNYDSSPNSDVLSPAPSLLTLHSSLPASPDPSTPASELAELHPDPDSPDGAHKRSQSASDLTSTDTLTVTKKGKKRRNARLKSPIFDALKLAPLSEITIPRPEQIKFAPLQIPPHRRLQTAAVATWALGMPICVILFFFLFSLPILWPVLIPYTIWALFIDNAHERGGRPRKWARKLKMWKYFAQYYPCSIVKEADLPPNKRYVFGYHPHGIIGMGAVAAFATDYTGFNEYFPGIKPHLLTLDSNFKIPFYRDFLMFHGICSVSKRSCRNILAQGDGSAITIVVGGATESLAAHPGTNDLTLKRRYGFIKVAIREGAQLVPVFSFGENDIYDQLANEKGSNVYKIQKAFQKLFGFTLPLFHGRGIFNYNYGLMPFRHPIVSVIGRPIEVTQCADPSDELVQEIQSKYIDELMRIWEKYKDLYAKNRTRELTLVE